MTPNRKFLAAMITAGVLWNHSASALDIPPEITTAIQQHGTARVIVELDVPWQPEGMLRGAEAVVAQRQQLTDTQQQFVTTLSQDLVNSGLFDDVNSGDGTPLVKPERTYETLPYLVLEVSEATLPLVQQQILAKGLTLDHADEPSLTQSLPLIGADQAWAAGHTGKGQRIAVLDTGVDQTHPFFATNRVVQEACFSNLCPPPPSSMTAPVYPGAAVPCNYDTQRCSHGTHVAGIAASVAKEASIIAVQVFSKQLGMALSSTSDQLAALDWLHKTYGQFGSSLAAVNLSLGGGKFTSACDGDPRKKAIDNLRSVGIATIIASGKQGYSDGINAPACISSAISVGATDKNDALATDSNSASFLSLLAPGVDIVSSLPGGQTGALSGTSMAAPHVAGAWAVLKAAKPKATVDGVLSALQSTGKAVTGKGVTKPRIQLDKALEIQPTAKSYQFITQWSSCGSYSNHDFYGPLSIAVDSGDNVYTTENTFVAVTQRVCKFDSNGSFITSVGDGDWFMGFNGVEDGDIATDSNGNVYIYAHHQNPTGATVRKINGNLTNDSFDFDYLAEWWSLPAGSLAWTDIVNIAVDDVGNLYMSNGKKFDTNLGVTTQWGSVTGHDVAIDSHGDLYVTSGDWDSADNRVQKFDRNGNYLTQWGTSGTGNGQFSGPMGIAVDRSDNIYVADAGNRRIQKFNRNGAYLTQWAIPETNGLSYPENVAIDSRGNVYVAVTEFVEPADFKGYIQKFAPVALHVTKVGKGTITSVPASIDCGVYCDSYLENTTISLTATPASAFKAWSGDCTGTNATVNVTIDKVKNCTATFELPSTYPLNVTKVGNGSVKGTGIDCGTDCTEELAINTSVTLLATATSGTVFKGWTGDCTGTDANMTVTMDKMRNCTATFESAYPLHVIKTGTGNGKIVSTGIDCGTDCTEELAVNSTVTLVANAAVDATFKEWTGDCTGTHATVTITMDKAKNCIADFFYDVQPLANNYELVTQWETAGNFDSPMRLAVDGADNLYAAEIDRILKFDSNLVELTTEQRQWSHVADMAVDSSGNIYLTDSYSGTVWKAGNNNWNRFIQFPGPGSNDRNHITGSIAVDSAGNTYVASNCRIQKFNRNGSYLTQWDVQTSGNEASTCLLIGVAVDNSGNIYVVDSNNYRIQKFDSKGAYLTQWGSAGTGNGQFASAEDSMWRGNIATDRRGNVYVADGGNQRIQKFDANGNYLTQWRPTADETYTFPVSVAIDSHGNVYVATYVTMDFTDGKFRIQKFALVALPLPPTYSLNVTLAGTGKGSVSGTGINCGTDCAEDYVANTQVTLTATPTTGSTFKGWSGDCTGTEANTTVTLDKAKNCMASFSLLTYTLNVTKTGNGNIKGTGIDCGTDCTEANLAANTQVTLTATPDAGNQFAGWAGACTGTATTTTVTLTADQSCEAKFEPAGIPLTVKKADDGRGRIIGHLSGETTSLTCDSACQTASYNYPKDGVVILTAPAEKGHEFKTWSCTGSSYTPGTQPNTIKVTMTTETTCTANFDAIPGQLFTLTVNLIGTGMGTVTASKVGLECQGTQCSGVYAKGTKLTLTAKPNAFSNFLNWGDACTANSLKVPVTLTQDVTCTVQFQSHFELAAQEMIEAFYSNVISATQDDFTTAFPRPANEERLLEIFQLAAIAKLQVEVNLAATGQWPAQFNGIPQYATSPVGSYTQDIRLQAGEYILLRVKLLNATGVEEEVDIVIYYGEQPPVLGDSTSARGVIKTVYFPTWAYR